MATAASPAGPDVETLTTVPTGTQSLWKREFLHKNDIHKWWSSWTVSAKVLVALVYSIILK